MKLREIEGGATIRAAAGIDPADQTGPDDDFRSATRDARPSEIKVFDNIFGVLHSSDYRRTFAEFLVIDFPRIPCPAETDRIMREFEMPIEGAAVV